jgi:glutamate synthase (NADPH/NADH) large chain
MTGGTAVILGPVGDNFGAGFTGGAAFIYDADNTFERRVNPDTLLWDRLASSHWESALQALIARHVAETGSRLAARLLNDWEQERRYFWHVVPKEYVKYLAAPMRDAVAVAAE